MPGVMNYELLNTSSIPASELLFRSAVGLFFQGYGSCLLVFVTCPARLRGIFIPSALYMVGYISRRSWM